MGTTVSTVWYVETPDPSVVLRAYPVPDRNAAQAFARQLFPGYDVAGPESATLADQVSLGPDEILVGVYAGLTVVCARELTTPHPSELADRYVYPALADRTVLIATDPQHAWGGFAIWEEQTLRRSFSATRVHIHEDAGLPQSWELPYWSGRHPIVADLGELPDPQWLPFDPALFADAANQYWLGFGYGPGDPLDLGTIALWAFTLQPLGVAPAGTADRPTAEPPGDRAAVPTSSAAADRRAPRRGLRRFFQRRPSAR